MMTLIITISIFVAVTMTIIVCALAAASEDPCDRRELSDRDISECMGKINSSEEKSGEFTEDAPVERQTDISSKRISVKC